MIDEIPCNCFKCKFLLIAYQADHLVQLFQMYVTRDRRISPKEFRELNIGVRLGLAIILTPHVLRSYGLGEHLRSYRIGVQLEMPYSKVN